MSQVHTVDVLPVIERDGTEQRADGAAGRVEGGGFDEAVQRGEGLLAFGLEFGDGFWVSSRAGL